jgi:PAS domain S-box-containing protein
MRHRTARPYAKRARAERFVSGFSGRRSPVEAHRHGDYRFKFMATSASRVPVVLSADDDEDAHFLLKRAFAKAGLRADLKQVNDGSEAISYLAGEGQFADRTRFPFPNVLLLDLKMPNVNGFGVLEHVRKQANLKDFPVIVFSSSDNEKDLTEAHALGCSSYVVKPTDFQKLIEFVRSLETDFLGGDQPAAPRTPAEFARFTARPTAPSAPGNVRSNEPSRLTADSPDVFRLLVEQVKDYAIFMLDREGYILTWNEGARRLKGYEPNEIIGKHFSAFYPHQDIETEKPAFELRMAQEMGRYEEEGWRVRKDGSRFWADVVITPLRDKGTLSGYAKVTRDLTQRKLQEENFQRLLESEERFRLLVEQVKDYAIFILDAKGNIASWNQGARRIKGYSSDEIIGRHFSTFYTPEDLRTDKPTMELTVAIREGRYEEEGWRVRKDGTRFWASVVITALWDKRGNLTGFAKVTRDLTQRKREQEAMKHKNEELEAFAHTLSHDLRAPLRSISSFAQILKHDRKDLSAPEQETYLEKIFKAAQSMESLISDILKLSQLNLTQAPHELLAMDEVVDEALALLEGEINKTEAEVIVRKPLPEIEANRTLMLQIFTNLLSNALKFTAPGRTARVEIFAEVGNGDCHFHVKDGGVGVPKEFQEAIFKIFERGAADDDSSGTGVGLAIVRKAVDRMGGRITVESEPGQGSDFVVTIPCEVPSPLATVP